MPTIRRCADSSRLICFCCRTAWKLATGAKAQLHGHNTRTLFTNILLSKFVSRDYAQVTPPPLPPRPGWLVESCVRGMSHLCCGLKTQVWHYHTVINSWRNTDNFPTFIMLYQWEDFSLSPKQVLYDTRCTKKFLVIQTKTPFKPRRLKSLTNRVLTADSWSSSPHTGTHSFHQTERASSHEYSL